MLRTPGLRFTHRRNDRGTEKPLQLYGCQSTDIVITVVGIQVKKGWVNRNRILVVGGQPTYIIVPLKEQSSFVTIRDINIDTNVQWRNKMLKQLYFNYKKSKFFDDIYPLVEQLIRFETTRLTEINIMSIKKIAFPLEINTEIISDISRYDSFEEEFSTDSSCMNEHQVNGLYDNKHLRIFHICKNEQADTYINAIGGIELYDNKAFEKENIDLKFIHTLPYSYEQKSKEFYPNLSIIDVMMNCGKEGTQKLLKNYELISAGATEKNQYKAITYYST